MIYLDNKWVECNDSTIVHNSQPNYSEGYVYVYELATQYQTQTALLQDNSAVLNIPNVSPDNTEIDLTKHVVNFPVNKVKTSNKSAISSANMSPDNTENDLTKKLVNIPLNKVKTSKKSSRTSANKMSKEAHKVSTRQQTNEKKSS